MTEQQGNHATQGDTGQSRPQCLRILLAEDHTIVRRGLYAILSAEEDMEVVGEADNGRDAVDFVRMLHPDVVIMDVAMPFLNGLEATKAIKSKWPQVRVVMLTMYRQDELGSQIEAAGADAHVTKSASSTKLLQAIRGLAVKGDGPAEGE